MEDYLAGHRQFLKKASFVNKAALFKDAEEDAEGTENSGSETPSGGSDIIFPNAIPLPLRDRTLSRRRSAWRCRFVLDGRV